MTGALVWAPQGEDRHAHDRLLIALEDGEVRYRDQRKLQGVWLAGGDEECTRIMGRQGPDALGLTRPELQNALAGRRAGIKAVLMDQRVVGRPGEPPHGRDSVACPHTPLAARREA